MPEVWCALKKSLACTKSLLCDVHEPKAIGDSISNEATSKDMSGCLRSKSNLRDVLCGSKRHSKKTPVGSSSGSMANSEVIISIFHEIEAQIKTDSLSISRERKARLKADSSFMDLHKTWISNFVTRKGQGHASSATDKETFFPSNPRKSIRSNRFNDHSKSICQECGGVFDNSDAVESHHLSKHAVTELAEGDSSRKVIELICQRSWLKSKHKSFHIEKVFKVHNSPKTLSWFEEQRKTIKRKASKQHELNPRCLVDGNELLRFHGTTFATYGSHSQILCDLDSCGVCQILRNGFVKKIGNHGTGVLNYATSRRAFESMVVKEEDRNLKKALMVCRVIAGRICNRDMEKDEVKDGSEFDSLGVKMEQNSEFEELHVLNPRAVIPCFVVTYKQ